MTSMYIALRFAGSQPSVTCSRMYARNLRTSLCTPRNHAGIASSSSTAVTWTTLLPFSSVSNRTQPPFLSFPYIGNHLGSGMPAASRDVSFFAHNSSQHCCERSLC
jgi:hypothetical protein